LIYGDEKNDDVSAQFNQVK